MPNNLVSTRLRDFLSSGLTTTFAIGVATGIEEEEIARVLLERVEPTAEQAKRLKWLLGNYELAVKLVNIEMAKQRFAGADNT